MKVCLKASTPCPLKKKGMKINKYSSSFTKNQSPLSITSQRNWATSLIATPVVGCSIGHFDRWMH